MRAEILVLMPRTEKIRTPEAARVMMTAIAENPISLQNPFASPCSHSMLLGSPESYGVVVTSG